MKTLLLVVMLAIPAMSEGTDPTCGFTELSTCWQGCYRTACGGIGGGSGIGFAAKYGLWYSTCSTTGANCSGGVACQYMSLVITYQDCNMGSQFIFVSSCCDAGSIWLRSSTEAGMCPIPETSLLPIPVQEIS